MGSAHSAACRLIRRKERDALSAKRILEAGKGASTVHGATWFGEQSPVRFALSNLVQEKSHRALRTEPHFLKKGTM